VYPWAPKLPVMYGQSLPAGARACCCAKVAVGIAITAMAIETAATEWVNFIRISSSLFRFERK
jgi:hypothetical protein